MSFHITTLDRVTLVKFTERKLDAHSLRENLDGLVKPGHPELHLDFSDVEYLGNAGLSALLGLQRQVQLAEGQLVLRNLSPFLSDLFRITRLDTVFDVQRDRASA
jgi:anti-anti-sigma factor